MSAPPCPTCGRTLDELLDANQRASELRAIADAARELCAALPRCEDDCEQVATKGYEHGGCVWCDHHGGNEFESHDDLRYAAPLRRLLRALGEKPR